MKSKRLFIIIAVLLVSIFGVSPAALMRVQAAESEKAVGAGAMAAKAENADQREYSDTELCSMAKYFYMRTSESRA